MKKIFVIDFDGVLVVDEAIQASSKEEAMTKIHPLEISSFKKVMDYLYSQGHSVVLGSTKSLWNEEHQIRYQTKYHQVNTNPTKCGNTTFSQYHSYMLYTLDHFFGSTRSYLRADEEFEIYRDFQWPEKLQLANKNGMLKCVQSYFESKFQCHISPEQIVLLDDNASYGEQFDNNYKFILADPHCDEDLSHSVFFQSNSIAIETLRNNRSLFLLQLLAESLETEEILPRISLDPARLCQQISILEQEALAILKGIPEVNKMFLNKFITPLKSFYLARNYPGPKISFLTDLEGNLDYLKSWVDHNKIVKFDEKGSLIFTDHDSMFVFGGDAVDKGSGDLKILDLLVNFKLKYPERVILLAGNRDINKTRFTYELDPLFIRERFLIQNYGQDMIPKPKVLLVDYLKDFICKQGWIYDNENKDNFLFTTYRKFLASSSDQICQIIYLKWMLTETMGCGPTGSNPGTFELRRQDLLRTRVTKTTNPIPDVEVLDSFLNSVSKEGSVTKFLHCSQIGTVIGETLFVHGAITNTNLGALPPLWTAATTININTWMIKLNSWYHACITDWINNPKHINPVMSCAHGELNHYALDVPYSVVYASWFDREQQTIAPISPQIKHQLSQSGIHRVITGHQPFGDFPLVIRDEPNFEAISCDTSYSDKSASDNRGKAEHCLTVFASNIGSHIEICGTRRSGCRYSMQLPALTRASSPCFFGVPISDNEGKLWWVGVQGVNPDTHILRYKQIRSYEIIEEEIPVGAIAACISSHTPLIRNSFFKQSQTLTTATTNTLSAKNQPSTTSPPSKTN
ncbi:MAG: metallophosphoesterase [Gammaproteobacteria bacterium]